MNREVIKLIIQVKFPWKFIYRNKLIIKNKFLLGNKDFYYFNSFWK